MNIIHILILTIYVMISCARTALRCLQSAPIHKLSKVEGVLSYRAYLSYTVVYANEPLWNSDSTRELYQLETRSSCRSAPELSRCRAGRPLGAMLQVELGYHNLTYSTVHKA